MDERGDVRAVNYPTVRGFKRMGLPHPYRSYLRICPWWWAVVFTAPVLGEMAFKYVVVAVFGVRAFGWVLTYSAFGLPRGAVYMLGFLLYMLVAYGVLLQFFSRFIRGRYVNEMLANRHCLWCLYDLSGGLRDADERTQCPECSGVWRLP